MTLGADEHRVALRQSLDTYRHFQKLIAEVDAEMGGRNGDYPPMTCSNRAAEIRQENQAEGTAQCAEVRRSRRSLPHRRGRSDRGSGHQHRDCVHDSERDGAAPGKVLQCLCVCQLDDLMPESPDQRR